MTRWLAAALVATALSAIPDTAQACLEQPAMSYIFFSKHPAHPPAGVVIAKVRVPPEANLHWDSFDLELLEETAGLRGEKRIRLLLDGPISNCRNWGITDGPAYVIGMLKHMPGGGVVLVPFWLHGKIEVPGRPREVDRYIVDPAYLHLIEEARHGK